MEEKNRTIKFFQHYHLKYLDGEQQLMKENHKLNGISDENRVFNLKMKWQDEFKWATYEFDFSTFLCSNGLYSLSFPFSVIADLQVPIKIQNIFKKKL